MKIDLLKDLIDLWAEYQEQRQEYSLVDFSNWLSGRINISKSEEPKQEDLLFLKMELGKYLGRVINFGELWGKMAFKNLPIKRFEELALLQGIQEMRNPTKSEIAELLVNEKSTAFEILKRFNKLGLVVDTVDEQDKRIRRVTLTEQGLATLINAGQQAAKVAEILVGKLNVEEMKFMLEKLKELDLFHSKLLEGGNFSSIDDVLDSAQQ